MSSRQSSSYDYQTLSPPWSSTSMSSRQSSSHNYQPLSPPWTPSIASPPSLSPRYAGAPARPYIPLPPCDDYVQPHGSPHHGLITPPPSPARIHQVLCSRSTVVRYDLATDPRTIRMSSSSPQPSFPGREPASTPSAPVLYIQCELTGHTITIHSRSGVTCFDIMVQLHRFFDQAIPSDDWQRVRGPQRDAMKAAYTRRTGRVYGPSAHMKLVDYLVGQTIFKRLLPKQSDTSGTTWLLRTTC